MADDSATGAVPEPSSLDRSDRPGRVGLLLVLSGLLVGACVGLTFVANEQAQPLILALLALLAMAGVFFLFALAIGAIQLSGQSARDDVTRAVVDGAPEAALVVEDGGRMIYANEAYMRLSGGDSFGTLRTVERLFVGEPDVSEAVYRLAEAARDGRALTEEIRMAPLSGGSPGRGVAWYRLTVRPIPRSRRDAVLWTIADVTRERAGQEDVFQQLQQAVDYLDHAPAGFFSLDPDGAVVYLNGTLAGWLGYDLATVGSGGLTLSQIAPGADMLAGKSGKPGEVRTEHLDIDLRRRNGHPLPVRLYHRIAYGADGRPGPSRTFVINRSPGAEADEPQRAAEVRLARFLNNSPIAIATLGRDGRVVRANNSYIRMFQVQPPEGGEAAEDHYEPILRDALVERDRGDIDAALAKAERGLAEIAPIEVALVGPGNRSARVWLSPADADGSSGPDAQSDSERIILYALDTTAQRALEQQVAQAQKMDTVGQLAGGIAHDFNNVLQAIIGYSDLLLASHRPTDHSFQDIMQIKQNANRAASLVRQLLAFSRRQTLRPEVMNVGEALSDLTLLLKRLLGERIVLDLRHGRDVWQIKADVNQFEQVVVNLAVNARDAMPTGGKLLIRTANLTDGQARPPEVPSGEHVLIEVLDTGEGIPPAIMEKIFEPFFTTKEIGKGTGLGLSTVFGIVKQSGGTIAVQSQVGEGTAFRLYFPKHVPEAEPMVDLVRPQARLTGRASSGSGGDEAEALVVDAAREMAREPEPRPAPPKPLADHVGQGKVLLVEDEDPVRAVNSRALAGRGYTVLAAASGHEALQIMAEHPDIDLVVSDVVMPEMDGPSLMREMRKARPDLKVIFVSGYAEDAFRNMPDSANFEFLSKPFSLKQLVETVKKTMAG